MQTHCNGNDFSLVKLFLGLFSITFSKIAIFIGNKIEVNLHILSLISYLLTVTRFTATDFCKVFLRVYGVREGETLDSVFQETTSSASQHLLTPYN